MMKITAKSFVAKDFIMNSVKLSIKCNEVQFVTT
jgi:hypothetical protein